MWPPFVVAIILTLGALPWDVWDSTKFFQFLLWDLEGVPLLEDSSVLFIEPTSVARSVLGDTRG